MSGRNHLLPSFLLSSLCPCSPFFHVLRRFPHHKSLARATSRIFQVSAQTQPLTGIKEAISNSTDQSTLLYLLCLPIELHIFSHNDNHHTDYNCMIIINEGFWSPKLKTLNWIYLVFNHKLFINVCQLEIYRFQLSVMANGCD